jgi:4-hydroxythreonine-4-phosphate dehydrogenase
MRDDKLRIGISHGDINGISYEILLRTFADTHINDFFVPIIYGSPKVAAFYRKYLNIDSQAFNLISNPDEANIKRTNIINVSADDIRVEVGKISAAAGIASVAALKSAVKDLKNNKIDAIVTCPINKSNVQTEHFRYSGHTEYFASEFDTDEYMMMMISPVIRMGFVTTHLPINKISENINKDLIMRKIDIMMQSLIVDFMINKPRIAVLSLNPHAGDNGLLGNEEENIIRPVINEYKAKGMLIFGPYPPDSFFASGMFKSFDASLAIYHDQGMIPFKLLSYDNGVNYTCGLPIVRTSPVHGTAYDIAGTNRAKIESCRESLYAAVEIYKNRKLYNELTANPLKKVDPETII